MRYETYDLRLLVQSLVDEFPLIESLWLFGSRRYRTGSLRSDLDILVVLQPDSYIRPNELRPFSQVECPALDLFLVDGGKATSCANESRVVAASFDQLATKLEAVEFWNRQNGFLDADIEWEFEIPVGVEFAATAMISDEPYGAGWRSSLRSYFRELEAEGLPTSPYLGGSARDVAAFLDDLIARVVIAALALSPRGKGWNVRIKNEYDFQNLFFLSVKPWLPGLGREEVTIRYDGQDKIADFNLFGSQVIVEMKHVRDVNTKAAVAKTLEGLGEFYRSHPNVRVVIFAILVESDVDLDGAKWESDFSYMQRQPEVWTRVYWLPAERTV